MKMKYGNIDMTYTLYKDDKVSALITVLHAYIELHEDIDVQIEMAFVLQSSVSVDDLLELKTFARMLVLGEFRLVQADRTRH